MKNLLITILALFCISYGGIFNYSPFQESERILNYSYPSDNAGNTTRIIEFQNKEGVAVDDLHILMKGNNITFTNGTFPQNRHVAENTWNFYGATIQPNGMATLIYEATW